MLDKSKISEDYIDLANDLESIQKEAEQVYNHYVNETNSLIQGMLEKASMSQVHDFDVESLAKEVDQLFSNGVEFIWLTGGKIENIFAELVNISEIEGRTENSVDYYAPTTE